MHRFHLIINRYFGVYISLCVLGVPCYLPGVFELCCFSSGHGTSGIRIRGLLTHAISVDKLGYGFSPWRAGCRSHTICSNHTLGYVEFLKIRDLVSKPNLTYRVHENSDIPVDHARELA